MKVYLDDERKAPSGWKLVKTPKEVINLLKTGKVTELSLDHDLGDDVNIGTGYDVLLWIEKQVYTKNFKAPKLIKVHSANVSARTKMEQAIKSIQRKNENKLSLKSILKEAFDRNAIVIDDKGKIYKDIKYHGDIIYKFDELLDNVLAIGIDRKDLKRLIAGGTSDINKVIDAFGFIRCGIWSQSKRQLYVMWNTPTKQAKVGLIKLISSYKPNDIYVEDIRHPNYDGMYTKDEFIEEYL